MTVPINKQEMTIKSENYKTYHKKTDKLTQQIMKKIFDNDTFMTLYEEASNMFKLGVLIKSAESQKFSYTEGSSSHIRRIKPLGKTDGIIIEYDKNITVREAKKLIIFELANATFSKHFDQLDSDSSKGKISKEDYIRNNEYYEWLAINKAYVAMNMIDKNLLENISKQLNDFEYHLSIQKRSGHSSVYEKRWEKLCPRNHKELLKQPVPEKKSMEETEKYLLLALIGTIGSLCIGKLIQNSST